MSYTIGQLAKRLQVRPHTLRFYEKKKLLVPSGRSESNYRQYTGQDLKTARFIFQAKAAGFSLQDIEAFLSMRGELDQHSCGEVKAIADEKLAEVEATILHLQELRGRLKRLSDACSGGAETASNCSIIESLEGGPSV